MSMKVRHLMRGLGLVCALALSVTACGSSDGGDAGTDKISSKDIHEALDKGGSLTVWSWDPTLKPVVDAFEKEHPKVDVKLVNAGTSADEYTKLQNAISAGKGVPDVAQIEYFALPQYSLAKSVVDLTSYGAGSMGNFFSPGPWSSVKSGKGVFALPMDSGPMALFYNKKVFDKYGIKVPTTWDEYLDAARKLHQADPKAYITSDTGDAGLTTSLLWEAGSRPYKADGTDVTINFSDEGAAAYTRVWQKLIDEKLIAPITGWTDEWYKGLGNGTIATLPTGAWMPANFATGVKEAAGQWRVAPLPQWTKGGDSSAENGGSSMAIPTKGKNRELAYAFLEYACTGDGVQTRIKNGAFPATLADLHAKSFQDTKFPYFGGQEANKIFADSASTVPDDWSYLPFQVYANSIFNDTAGKAYVSKTPLSQGLKKWQESSAKYGKDQGFTVH